MSDTIPLVMSKAGLVPQLPADLRAQLIALVAATNPGYTANLPGTLIEDIASTDVGAMVLCDQALVELVNSITPYGANEFILNQLGQIYGVQPAVDFNTSVFVVFSGPPGFVIAQGFLVGDGTHQYIVQDGGVIQSDGDSASLFAVATIAGTWAVPEHTVDQLVTSIPSTITLTVDNPLAGTPSPGPEPIQLYRSRVLQAGLAASQGMARYLRTLLDNVDGVQPRLVGIREQQGGGWEILVGGGDPFDVAYAIYKALFDISTLTGSVTRVTGITNANPGVVTTDINHGFETGRDDVTISGVVGMSGVNGGPYTIIVITEKTFSFGVDTTSSGAYVSGGIVEPNLRNQTIAISDYPDTYEITFVVPPLQTVDITLTWNTNSPNIVSPAAMQQVGAPALVSYVNSIPVGQPINVFELQNAFQLATIDIVPTPFLSRMVFAVSINGVPTSPSAGTCLVIGDPESFFQTDTTRITIIQG